jgi:hypothetical protein
MYRNAEIARAVAVMADLNLWRVRHSLVSSMI